MFGSKKPHYMKLRTNLRLCINRLKLMEKKKTELGLKARKEIADYLRIAKDDRARIRVEHIVREDYLVEAMEIIEMFCDLLLARFGLIEKMKAMDPGLEESIATIIWAAPRLYSDIPELREVSNQLTLKYGKEYSDACRDDQLEKVNQQVMTKMAITAPPKKLIESYLIEIAKTYDVAFEPDPTAFEETQEATNLIDIGFEGIDTMPKDGKGGPGGGFGGPGGFGGGGGGMKPLLADHTVPSPVSPAMGTAPFGGAGPAGMAPPPAGFAYPPQQGPPPGVAQYQQPSEYRPIPPLPNRPPVGGQTLPGSDSSGSDMKPPLEGNFNMGDQQVPPAGVTGPPKPPHYDDVFGPAQQGPSPSQPTLPVPPTDPHMASTNGPGPSPSSGLPNLPAVPSNDLPGLPSIPSDSLPASGGPKEDIDFDDLTRRFEELKKKK